MDTNRFLCRNECPRRGRWIWGLALAALVGCQGNRLPTAAVEGKVSYQGKPLEFGSVLFQPDRGPPARGLIGQDGAFRLSTYGNGDGAIVGLHRVQVVCYESQRSGNPPRPKPGEELNPGKLLIPPKYAQFETSGLQVEVKPRDNEPFLLNLE